MTVTLDGRLVELVTEPDCTLERLIDAVRARCLKNRLVVSVAINGRPLMPPDLDAQLAAPVHGADEIELFSGDAVELVAEALRGTALQLDDAAQEAPQIADEITTGQVGSAMERISVFLEVWSTCRVAVLHSSELLQRDLTQVPLSGRRLGEHFGELAARLTDLRDAFEARDLVTLSDLLHYEFAPLCERWRDLFDELASIMAAGSGSNQPAP